MKKIATVFLMLLISVVMLVGCEELYMNDKSNDTATTEASEKQKGVEKETEDNTDVTEDNTDIDENSKNPEQKKEQYDPTKLTGVYTLADGKALIEVHGIGDLENIEFYRDDMTELPDTLFFVWKFTDLDAFWMDLENSRIPYNYLSFFVKYRRTKLIDVSNLIRVKQIVSTVKRENIVGGLLNGNILELEISFSDSVLGDITVDIGVEGLTAAEGEKKAPFGTVYNEKFLSEVQRNGVTAARYELKKNSHVVFRYSLMIGNAEVFVEENIREGITNIKLNIIDRENDMYFWAKYKSAEESAFPIELITQIVNFNK